MAEKDKNRFRTSVILPAEIHEKVAKLAETNDVSVAWIIRQAVIRFLEDQGNDLRLKLDKRDK